MYISQIQYNNDFYNRTRFHVTSPIKRFFAADVSVFYLELSNRNFPGYSQTSVVVLVLYPDLSCRMLHPRPSFRGANYLARAAACGNNFPDFPAVARAFCREAINFFASHPKLTVTCHFLSSVSVSLSVFLYLFRQIR